MLYGRSPDLFPFFRLGKGLARETSMMQGGGMIQYISGVVDTRVWLSLARL